MDFDHTLEVGGAGQGLGHLRHGAFPLGKIMTEKITEKPRVTLKFTDISVRFQHNSVIISEVLKIFSVIIGMTLPR